MRKYKSKDYKNNKNKKTRIKKAYFKKTSFSKQKLLCIASSILLVFLVFSASFFLVFFDKSFYDSEFKRLGQYDEFGLEGVRNTVDNLINYLVSWKSNVKDEEMLLIFLPEEKAHLADVRRIISVLKLSSLGALLLLTLTLLKLNQLKDFRKNVRKVLIYSGFASIAILLIIFLFSSLNFSAFFEGFHRLFFPQGNYSFPEHYLLIKLFPEAFFIAFARRMLLHASIISVILILLGSSSAFTITNSRGD